MSLTITQTHKKVAARLNVIITQMLRAEVSEFDLPQQEIKCTNRFKISEEKNYLTKSCSWLLTRHETTVAPENDVEKMY